MLFNSYVFIFAFFPVVAIGYYSLLYLKKIKQAKVWLLCCSLFFYAWWEISYLPLLLGSILINYALFRWLINVRLALTTKTKKRRRKKSTQERCILALALLFNIGLLGFFKYVDFFIWNINWLAGSNLSLIGLILPLGISFFTLQQIAFQIDAYEEVVEDRGLLNYALFVSFFAQLVAGPIVHHKEMMPQFEDKSRQKLVPELFYSGLWLFSIGLFKKVVIADTFAVWATNGYDMAGDLTFFPAWATVICYTLQLYFDFSGYSDMALGLGRMLNIILPTNFNSPFKATSLVEFWNRWHMTLTRFITTYLYFPLTKVMPNQSFSCAMLATFITMFVAGLWHGAAWTFVIFGSIHGLGLVINNIARRLTFVIPKVIGWLLTMFLVFNSFAFFRAKDVDEAGKLLSGMYGFNGISWQTNQFVIVAGIFTIDTIMMLGAIIAAFIAILTMKNSTTLTEKFQPTPLTTIIIALLFWLALAHFSTSSEFLYFNF